MRTPIPFTLPVFALALVAGCRSSVPTYKVTGTVTYRGQRLTTGVVAFHHTDGTSPMAKGDIRPDGSFELSTFRHGDGAAAGPCKVTVTSMLPARGVEGVDRDYQPPKPLIPLKYMRLVETTLTATVEPKDNVISLSLTP